MAEVTRRAPNMLVPRGKLQDSVVPGCYRRSSLDTYCQEKQLGIFHVEQGRNEIYPRDALVMSLFEADRYSAGKRHEMEADLCPVHVLQ